MNSNNKKLILSLLICGFSHNMFSNDLAKNYFLKLSSGALLGGFGAVVSGFSMPMATLGALAGSWISNAWQSNNQLLDALQQANRSTMQAISSLEKTKVSQAGIDKSLQEVTTINSDINSSLQQSSSRLTDAQKNMESCLSIGSMCTQNLEYVRANISNVSSQVSSINSSLRNTLETQKRYKQEFEEFVLKNQRREKRLLLFTLCQQKKVRDILQQQDILQSNINSGLSDLKKFEDQSHEFAQKQILIDVCLTKIKDDCAANLVKQKNLELELSRVLESQDHKDHKDFSIAGIARLMMQNTK